MSNPQRHPKTGVYRLRRAVPKALRLGVAGVLGREKPVAELIRTLGTRDPRTAKLEMVKAEAWADGVLEAARSGAKPLSNKEANALAGIWYRRLLHDWEATPALREEWAGWHHDAPASPYEAMPDRDDGEDIAEPRPSERRDWEHFLGPFVEVADKLLQAEAMSTDRDSKDRLAYLLAVRLGQASTRFDKRQAGDYGPDPIREQLPELEKPKAVLPAATCTAPGLSISALLQRWKDFSTTKPRTQAETTYIVNMLIAFVGHDDAARLTRADMIRWRDAGKAEGIENNTLNHRLSRVGQVLKRGFRDDLLLGDVSRDTSLPKDKPKPSRHYEETEAALILNATRLKKRASQRWAHWIMAFTGMRVAEVLQLTAGDIRRDGDVPYIHINEDDSTKSVKTSERRNMPIHAALIEEGFLAYVATVPGNEPLFPDKRLDENGNRGGRGWQVVGRLVSETLGIDDDNLSPDHAWRHRVSWWLRELATGKGDRDGLLGHAEQGTGAGYGKGDRYGARGIVLKELAAALAGVPLPAGVTAPPPPVIPWKAATKAPRKAKAAT